MKWKVEIKDDKNKMIEVLLTTKVIPAVNDKITIFEDVYIVKEREFDYNEKQIKITVWENSEK